MATKIFLLRVVVYDGTHEHSKFAMVKAKDVETAQEIGERNMHDIYEDENEKYWNYGDGLTATRLKEVEEISRTDAETLDRLNIVHYLWQRKIEDRYFTIIRGFGLIGGIEENFNLTDEVEIDKNKNKNSGPRLAAWRKKKATKQ